MPFLWHTASLNCTVPVSYGIGTEVFKFSVKISADCMVSTDQQALARQGEQEG
jgi:hypothetical protein